MRIELNGVVHGKDWLISTHGGQSELARARELQQRPRCTCNQTKPQMYIAKRGTLFYMARMPGTSHQHAVGCQSHIIPDHVHKPTPFAPITLNTPGNILAQLWQHANANLTTEPRSWSDVRESLLTAAAEMSVDGANFSSHLLIPEKFDRDQADDQHTAYSQFYERSNGGTIRHWTIGIIKELTPSKYSVRMSIRHMPRIVFRVKNDKAQSLPLITDASHIQIALFVCHPVKSGILVTDIAAIELTHKLEPITWPVSRSSATPISVPPVLSEHDKLKKAAALLGMPPGREREEVIAALIDHFLAHNSSIIDHH